MPQTMRSRERVSTAIARRLPDRVPIHDSPWSATISRWRREGLPEAISPADYFGYEIWGMSADLTPRFPTKVIAEDDEYITETTPMGGIRKNHRDFSTTPEVIDCPVKTQDDWPPIKARLAPDFKRIDWASGWQSYQRAAEKGLYRTFNAACGYDLLQSYVRSEQLLMFMATDPGFVKDIAGSAPFSPGASRCCP